MSYQSDLSPDTLNYVDAMGFKSKLDACLLGKCWSGFLNLKREMGLVAPKFSSKSSNSMTCTFMSSPQAPQRPFDSIGKYFPLTEYWEGRCCFKIYLKHLASRRFRQSGINIFSKN